MSQYREGGAAVLRPSLAIEVSPMKVLAFDPVTRHVFRPILVLAIRSGRVLASRAVGPNDLGWGRWVGGDHV